MSKDQLPEAEDAATVVYDELRRERAGQTLGPRRWSTRRISGRRRLASPGTIGAVLPASPTEALNTLEQLDREQAKVSSSGTLRA